MLRPAVAAEGVDSVMDWRRQVMRSGWMVGAALMLAACGTAPETVSRQDSPFPLQSNFWGGSRVMPAKAGVYRMVPAAGIVVPVQIIGNEAIDAGLEWAG